jgi:hypothetical protein
VKIDISAIEMYTTWGLFVRTRLIIATVFNPVDDYLFATNVHKMWAPLEYPFIYDSSLAILDGNHKHIKQITEDT